MSTHAIRTLGIIGGTAGVIVLVAVATAICLRSRRSGAEGEVCVHFPYPWAV